MNLIECKHEKGTPHWDYYQCDCCGWVSPSGPADGRPNKGWFPSMYAFTEWGKYKTYPGMGAVVPLMSNQQS
jgi:hypothetical protein